MTDNGQVLEELAARVEAAEKPSPELFFAAFEAVHGGRSSMGQLWSRFCSLIDEEAFLDAAMALVPEGLEGGVNPGKSGKWAARLYSRTPAGNAVIETDTVFAATPALALTAASLRSRAAEARHGKEGGRDG